MGSAILCWRLYAKTYSGERLKRMMKNG